MEAAGIKRSTSVYSQRGASPSKGIPKSRSSSSTKSSGTGKFSQLNLYRDFFAILGRGPRAFQIRKSSIVNP